MKLPQLSMYFHIISLTFNNTIGGDLSPSSSSPSLVVNKRVSQNHQKQQLVTPTTTSSSSSASPASPASSASSSTATSSSSSATTALAASHHSAKPASIKLTALTLQHQKGAWTKWSKCSECRQTRSKTIKGKTIKQERRCKNAKCNLLYPINDKTCGTHTASLLKIVGGRESSFGAWPWQVLVLDRFKDPICGGTLITPEFVLTAAHCVKRKMYVRAGEHDLSINDGTEQQVAVSPINLKHPSYNADIVDSDIALLKLKTPLKLSQSVWPVCLPALRDQLKPSTLATILGWGVVSRSNPIDLDTPRYLGANVLNQARVPIVDFENCKKVYQNYFISENMICAGYRRGKVDSCAGDSGGPLLIQRHNKWFVYGVTSFGEGCGKQGKYGIYSKTSNFVNWIRETISLYGTKVGQKNHQNSNNTNSLYTSYYETLNQKRHNFAPNIKSH